MGIKLSDEVISAFNASDTVKALTTTDDNGNAHTVFKDSLGVDEDGDIVLTELLESSRSNSNLVHSLWFKRNVVIALLTDDKKSYEIVGAPERCIVSGPVFERYYKAMREKIPDSDLAAVWKIQPISEKDESFSVRLKEETEAHPLFLHLDRIRQGIK
jgi:hypothetical protein